MEYTYTYDNASARGIKNPIWWQSTVTSAGNLTSVIYRAFGQSFSKEDKTFAERPFRAVCETEYGISPFVEYGQE